MTLQADTRLKARCDDRDPVVRTEGDQAGRTFAGGRPAPPGHTRGEGSIHRGRRRVSNAMFQR